MKKNRLIYAGLAFAVLLLIGLCAYNRYGGVTGGEETSSKAVSDAGIQQEEQQWEEAERTPLGKYPETVKYTLGKISGNNNSNLPVGDTYEDNAYTRYLKEVLNIQNEDVFELETDGSYEEALEVAIADREIPDVLVANGWDNLERVVEYGLVEDLTQVYEECTTDMI